MKNFKLKKLLGLALIGGASVLSASTAFAAAGATISNTATLAYEVSGVLQTPVPSNTETFTEDLKINFTVTEVGGLTTTVTPGELLAYQTFTVTNFSNAPQDFLFSALDKGTGTFTPTAVQVFVDSAAGVVGAPVSVTFTSATDTGIFMDELGIGESRTVYIVASIPADALDTEVANMTLVAQVATGGAAAATSEATADDNGAPITNDDNNHTSPLGTYSNGNTAVAAGTPNNIANTLDGLPDTVFAEPTGTLNSAGAADIDFNGQHSNDDSYTVSTATLSVVKLASALWDPVNGNSNAKAIPGALVQYTITITNNGAASADLTDLTDTLTDTILDPNLVLSTVADATAPLVAETEHGATLGFGIKVVVTNSTRGAGTASNFCTGDTAADADLDGCSYDAAANATGNAIAVDLTNANLLDADVSGTGYAAGELKPTEVVTITYNIVVQ